MFRDALHINYQYGMCVGWQQPLAQEMGAELIDGKYLVLPENLGKGGSFFLEVMPGFSLLLADITFHKPVAFTKRASSDHFYMVYYNFSEGISRCIVDRANHRIGYQSKFGMGFTDSLKESIIIPKLDVQYYSLHLLIGKQLLMSLMGNTRPEHIIEALLDKAKNTWLFYSHIDSGTRLLLRKIKERSFDDPSFELLAKGTALKILTYLVKRLRNFEPFMEKLSLADTSGILNTRQYLLDNLRLDFPGIAVLADMAGMSESKYKKLFTKLMKASPNSFFLQEKLLLAQKLLQSGNFNSIREVAIEVGYSKPGYFSEAYKKAFSSLPQEAFVKTVI
jgi:AraC-like DNA-binding protein